MMPRKKRRTVIVVSILAIAIIVGTIYTLLYMNTNMFKSEQVLFKKYLGKEIEQLNNVYRNIGNTEYNKRLEQSKYTSEKQIKVNYTENLGTSLENTKNSINKLKLTIDGQTDKNNKYDYRDIKLLHNNKETFEVEYINKEDEVGIRFTDLYKQYTTTEAGKVKETLEILDLPEELLQKVPEQIDFDMNFKGKIKFTEAEKKKIKEEYLNLLMGNISKEKYTKQANKSITMNEKEILANTYVLTLPKEEMNRIYITILEKLKDDGRILSKLESINNETKEEYVRTITKLIDYINKNNIGQEEYKIAVYENEEKTVKVELIGSNYLISLENLVTKTDTFIKLTISKDGKEKTFTLEKENGKAELSIENRNDENKKIFNIEEKSKIENDKCEQSFFINIEDNDSKVEINIERKYQIVENFEEEVQLNEENRIQLTTLEEQQIKRLLERISNGVLEECKKLSDKVNIKDIQTVLEKIGLIDQKIVANEGASETEKRRFNAHFELLKGEDLENSDILTRLDSVKEYFVDVEETETEIRIKLDKDNKEEIDNVTLFSIIEKDKNKKRNFEIEYDEETGLASYIVLRMKAEEKR